MARVSGTGGSLNNSNIAAPTFTAPTVTANRSIVYRLTATNNGVSDTDDVTISVTAPVTPNQDLRGPTTSLPSDTYADAYAYTLALSAFWSNPVGRNFTWSNATGTFSSDPRQANFTGSLDATQLGRQRAAFDLWESYLNCTFTESPDSASIDIRCGLNTDADADFGSSVVAYAQ